MSEDHVERILCGTPGAGKKKQHQRIDARRESSTKRGYDHKWRKNRKHFLADHPLCVECLKIDRTVAANVVDHIIPHRGDKKLFNDQTNWQALCETCHNRKSASEGAFR